MRQALGYRILLIRPNLLVERHVGLAGPPPQLHSSAIGYNRGQPSRHLCLAFELVQVLVSRQKRILNRILRVGQVAQVSIGGFVKRGEAA
jgi:hypothetical protein